MCWYVLDTLYTEYICAHIRIHMPSYTGTYIRSKLQIYRINEKWADSTPPRSLKWSYFLCSMKSISALYQGWFGWLTHHYFDNWTLPEPTCLCQQFEPYLAITIYCAYRGHCLWWYLTHCGLNYWHHYDVTLKKNSVQAVTCHLMLCLNHFELGISYQKIMIIMTIIKFKVRRSFLLSDGELWQGISCPL